jgi:hypothetical protein
LGNKFSVFHETDLLIVVFTQHIEFNQLPERFLHRQIPEIKNGKVSDKNRWKVKEKPFLFFQALKGKGSRNTPLFNP